MAEKKKSISQIAAWLVIITLLGAALNIFLNIFSVPYTLLSNLLIPLGFFTLLSVMYTVNKFKFNTMLNLTLFVIIIGVLAFLSISSATIVPASYGIVYSIFQGLMPVMAGFIVGGIIVSVMGLLFLPGFKQKKLF